jgi:hypothetical protein
MSTTTDAKRRVGARVHAKAHFTMSESDAKRTFCSAWNTHLVSGTVESAHVNDSSKGVRVSVAVMWGLLAGHKLLSVIVRSITAGEAPRTPRVDSLQELWAVGRRRVQRRPPTTFLFCLQCALLAGTAQPGQQPDQRNHVYCAWSGCGKSWMS